MPTDYFGQRIAERYDETAADMFDPSVVDPVVDFLADLAFDGTALELGIGTGRIALPLAQRGIRIHGIDLSEAMVARLRAKPGAEQINVALAQLNQVTQQNASSSEELASAANNFNTQSGKLKETVSFFKLDKKGEVSHQRERIIGQIEQLRAILHETDSIEKNAKIDVALPSFNGNGNGNGHANGNGNGHAIRPSAKVISVENDFGGPAIKLDDFDSPIDSFDGKSTDTPSDKTLDI